MKHCAYCKRELEAGQRKYCSDVCSYAMQRVQVKVRGAAGARAPRRYYSYRPVSVDEPPKE